MDLTNWKYLTFFTCTNVQVGYYDLQSEIRWDNSCLPVCDNMKVYIINQSSKTENNGNAPRFVVRLQYCGLFCICHISVSVHVWLTSCDN